MSRYTADSDYDYYEESGCYRRDRRPTEEFGPATDLPRQACAWCGVELRPGPEPTSHGICRVCSARVLGEPA